VIVVYNLLVFIPIGVAMFVGLIFTALGPLPVVVGSRRTLAALTPGLPRPTSQRPGSSAKLQSERADLCPL
jgi:hypothetical protein